MVAHTRRARSPASSSEKLWRTTTNCLATDAASIAAQSGTAQLQSTSCSTLMTTFSDENSPATITLGSDVAGDFFFSKYPCLN